MDSGTGLKPPPPPTRTGFDPDGDGDADDFEGRVPRPPSVWRVYVPFSGAMSSGFFGEGYMVADAFATREDARSFVERNRHLGDGCRLVRCPATKEQVEVLGEG